MNPQPFPPQGPYRTPDPPPAPKRGGAFGTMAAGVGFLLLKFKSVFVLLKALPFLKFGLTGISMLIYIWVSAVRWGWMFGVGFTLLIFIHELGHGAAIRRQGLHAGWPIFIPFMGAVIALKGGQQMSADVNADISYGGPLWGTIASFGVLCLYFVSGSPMWLSLGYSGLFLNMFNMLPVRPLDGGAIAEVFSRKAWIVGVLLMAALAYLSPSPVLIIILVIAVMRALSGAKPNLPEAEPEIRSKWQWRYFGLLAFMGGGMYFAQRLLRALGELRS